MGCRAVGRLVWLAEECARRPLGAPDSFERPQTRSLEPASLRRSMRRTVRCANPAAMNLKTPEKHEYDNNE
jgi:hypothetical protein